MLKNYIKSIIDFYYACMSAEKRDANTIYRADAYIVWSTFLEHASGRMSETFETG